jgi:hypothetical protein
VKKNISKRTIIILVPLVLFLFLVSFLYPFQLLNIFRVYWPVVLVVIGILQTLNTRFKDFVSAILLMVTGVTLLILKLKGLSVEFFLNSWDGSLKELILNIFEWLIAVAIGINF